MKLGEVEGGAKVAAARRGLRASQPPAAHPGALPKTFGPEPDNQITLPARSLKSPGRPGVEERDARAQRTMCPLGPGARRAWRPEAWKLLSTAWERRRKGLCPRPRFGIFCLGSDKLAQRRKLLYGYFRRRAKERFLSS